MRIWVAIGLGIVVLTAAFVVVQRDRGGDVVSPAQLPDGGRSSPAQAIGADATTGQAESSAAVPELQTSPLRVESGAAVPILDAEQRAQARAAGNARINAQNSGSSELDPVPSGGVSITGTAPSVGMLQTDIAEGNAQSRLSGPLPGEGGPTVVGPLPGEGEPEVYGPLPGEGEPQVYGPLPGENDPQVLGPLPGEGEPEMPPAPLPGEG